MARSLQYPDFAPKLMKLFNHIPLQTVFQHIVFCHYEMSKSSSGDHNRRVLSFNEEHAFYKEGEEEIKEYAGTEKFRDEAIKMRWYCMKEIEEPLTKAAMVAKALDRII